MRIPSRLSLALAATACALLTSLLHLPRADGKDTDTALAEALFRDARKLMEGGHPADACPKFEESYRLVPKLGTLLNLATCHAEEGKTGSAWGEFTKAASLASQAGEKEREEYARTELAKLDVVLTKLVIRVPHPVAGIEVRVDDTVLAKAAWTTPIPLDPGDHAIEVSAPGKQRWTKTAVLPAGPNVTTVNVPKLVAAAAGEDDGAAPAPPAEPPDEPDDGSTQRLFGWVLGAVGVVGLGVGAGFGINTFMKQGDSDEHCNDANLCDQEGVDLRDEAATSATVSTVAFGVGLGALAVGVILLLTAPGDDEVEPAAAEALWVSPVAGPAQAGLAVGGSW